jgi:hypothetical protein
VLHGNEIARNCGFFAYFLHSACKYKVDSKLRYPPHIEPIVRAHVFPEKTIDEQSTAQIAI